MHIDLTIEIVVLEEKSSGDSKVFYCSDFAPVGQSLDLYVSEQECSIALYHPAAYDDPVLKERLSRKAMTYPGRPQEKMVLVGHVHGALPVDPASHVEVSRAHLSLKAIPVDER